MKQAVDRDAGKALMRLRVTCEQLGWDYNKVLVEIIEEFYKRNEMKIRIVGQIPGYKRK
jgi:hypothetical protein